MADDELDPGYAALPQELQARIDDAFDEALQDSATDAEPAHKRRKLDHPPAPGGFIAGGFIPEEQAAGGFIVDEPNSGGGFVRDESPAAGGFITDAGERQTHIPFSLIPTALQLLDLQPDDEDVLAVFRNAATGWGGGGSEGEDEDARVSRKDWRAVCAALLDSGGSDEDGDVDMDDRSEEAAEDGLEEAASDSGEEFVQSESGAEESADGSDDDYEEGGGGFVRSKGAKKGGKVATERQAARKTRSTAVNEDGEARAGLSARQKAECRAAFALFFPDVSEGELGKQRIAIKDITRVAKLLKEKVTAEETVEMLEAFSSAPDKTMGLSDFERMMISAKLA
ncbi:uncharacterized protein TRAVEDRAFT_47893 [Trametes versicolor FP-101664 SS1]|uniref:uncharacterized protein n=1 Tax=Trametes versicolor (strain FP-101664) TaxID=717944 RepID=UPI0004623A2E|nr:uncharacterized protein TRAVEDRAFT_47893 [Trametes versicolor FP-101664 SS1]EIW58750.1 hypothetical protein TRAVEDRAFT_47893 [Trametes versicolor FP-101664 SS1]